MKPGVTLLRAVAGVCTSLALTACGGPMTEQEAAAEEAEALATQEAEAGSCANWSGWSWDGTSVTCAPRLSCGTYCDEFGHCDANPATVTREHRYRVCFDQWGNYTHTEYEYWGSDVLHCGC